jgi:hypothetical protein
MAVDHVTGLTKGDKFPPELVSDLINKVKGKSSLAALSGQVPIPFDGRKEFVFTMDSEVDVVAESGAKSHGGIALTPVTITPIKVEYGARVTDEFMYAAEEEKINILKAFNEGFARKVARGFDLMAMHGVNPRTMSASTVINDNHLDSKVTQLITYTQADPDDNVEKAIQKVETAGGDVNGLILSPTMRAAFAAYKVNNVKQFPELSWGASPVTINGLRTEINKTVSDHDNDRAFVGDFANAFQWGYSKDIEFEVIPYGDPDNSGSDLKGHNQVYLRAEVYLGWGILDPEAFARIVKAYEVTITATPNGTTSSTTTTKIDLAFNVPVYGLTADDITLANDTGAATKGALTGSGKNWSLAITAVATQGNVKLTIADIDGFDFPSTATTVAVYKA